MEKTSVGTLSDFPINQIKLVTVNGKSLLMINVNGKLFASDVYCTHARVRLDKHGIITGNMLECDAHGAQFDCETGQAKSFPDEHPKNLAVYKVIIENNNVSLELS